MNYSKIIAGTMSWGKWGKNFSQAEMTRLIHHCFDHDIRGFDLADIYGGYTTEAEFGSAFAKSGIDRDHVQLISKCGIQHLSENRSNKVKHYNYSKEYIIWSVENSLNHLKTDYLDLMLLHRPSPLMDPHEIMEAVSRLAQEGKIIDFGVSNFTRAQMELISSQVPVTVNQIEFSLTTNHAMHNGLLDYLNIRKITPMAWSPLGTVFKEDNEQTRRIRKQLKELRDKYNASEDQLLLAWILKHPSGVIPVIGTTDKQRIIDSDRSTSIDLKIEDWFLILVASQGHKVP